MRKEKQCECCHELPLMHYKYWMCYKCGNLHIQDTAYPETSEN